MWRPPDATRHPLPDPGWPGPAEVARSLLFAPLTSGRLALETRTWVPAMVPWRATEEGRVTPAVLDWYRRFAEGRPGAMVVEATGVRDVPSGPLLRIGHDRFVPGLRELVATVREASEGHTQLFIQVLDFLAVKRRPDPAKYFDRHLDVSTRLRESLARVAGARWRDAPETEVRAFLSDASDPLVESVLTPRELESLRRGYRERVTDLHRSHVRDLPRTLPSTFAAAAARARDAGFDGVELHYAHAYTMASFLSRTNDRTDGYGSTPEGRLRLPLEVYRAVRSGIGDDWVVGCRMLGDEVIEGGSRIEDACRHAVAFARAGMDFLSISKGGKFEDAAQPRVGEAVYPYTGRSGYECMPTVFSDARGPFGRNVSLAAAVRRAVRDAGCETPIVAAGGIGTFRLAEAILRRGDADVIGAARQSLADPDWWLKLRLGRGDEIRRCEYTNYCEALDQRHRAVTCKLWDRVALDDPGIATTDDGHRRLVAPRWMRGRPVDP